MIYSAFLLGFLGSLHCFVMCGPISLLLPGDRTKQIKYISGRVIYNLGRVTTYAILGLIIGLVGEQTGYYLPQKVIFLSLGGILLTYLMLPARLKNRLSVSPVVLRLSGFVRRAFSKLTAKKGFIAQYSFGLVNGLIPCGLVYAAISAAFITANVQDSVFFMIFFGLGTFPMMMSFGILGSFISKIRKIPPKAVYTFSYFVLAVFMLYKGFYLPNNYYANSNEITICKMP